LESEVFLLGHWKNFDDLESSLSIDELIAAMEASRKKEDRDRKFFAAINGVDLEEELKSSGDVAELMNTRVASQEGFGVDEGLGFMKMGVDD
jgi:hypothetical protein